jgi:hypothetical protein
MVRRMLKAAGYGLLGGLYVYIWLLSWLTFPLLIYVVWHG